MQTREYGGEQANWEQVESSEFPQDVKIVVSKAKEGHLRDLQFAIHRPHRTTYWNNVQKSSVSSCRLSTSWTVVVGAVRQSSTTSMVYPQTARSGMALNRCKIRDDS